VAKWGNKSFKAKVEIEVKVKKSVCLFTSRQGEMGIIWRNRLKTPVPLMGADGGDKVIL